LEKKFMTGQEKMDLMKKLGCPKIGSLVRQNEMVLCEEINRLRECVKDLNRLVHDQVVVMQSALIEAIHNGHQAGLKWIHNELWGPGTLPDENDKWFYDASLYYCAHKTNPMGPCEICGKPSSRLQMKHVACCDKHLKEVLQKAGL
jgi:hypothetical protein